MTAVVTSNSYLASLLAGRPQVASSPLAWFNDLRAHAVDRVGALTVPTTRDEEWRFTDISPLTKIPFQPARSAAQVGVADIERFVLPEAGARLVFVDGVYVPQLSFNNAGITVENLATALTRHGVAMQPYLGRHAAFDEDRKSVV